MGILKTGAHRRSGNRFHAPLAGREGEAIALYQSGASTYQTARAMGVSKTWVCQLVRGIARDRSTAAQLSHPATSIHRRNARKTARRLWERTRGLIPRGFHIHHKDGDFTNNVIANLEVLSPSDHVQRHRPANPPSEKLA